MGYTTLATGLQLIVPDNGQTNWGTIFKNGTLIKINDHTHTGGGDGNKIPAAGLADYSIGKTQLSKSFALFEQSIAPTIGTSTISFSSGSNVLLDLSGAPATLTLALAGGIAGGRYFVKMLQAATPCVFTWPANVKFPGGVEPTQFCDASTISLFSLYFDGTNYLVDYELNLA